MFGRQLDRPVGAAARAGLFNYQLVLGLALLVGWLVRGGLYPLALGYLFTTWGVLGVVGRLLDGRSSSRRAELLFFALCLGALALGLVSLLPEALAAAVLAATPATGGLVIILLTATAATLYHGLRRLARNRPAEG